MPKVRRLEEKLKDIKESRDWYSVGEELSKNSSGNHSLNAAFLYLGFLKEKINIFNK